MIEGWNRGKSREPAASRDRTLRLEHGAQIALIRSLMLGVLVVLRLLPADTLHAQWLQTNGPCGGSINRMAAIGSNLVAGTSSGNSSGVYFSTNSGANWSEVGGNDFVHSYVFAFAVLGPDIFAGTAHGVYRSSDSGASWGITGLPSSKVNALAALGSTLVACTYYDDFYRSSDAGVSWQRVSGGGSGSDIFTLTAYGTILYMGSSSGAWASPDSGVGWGSVGLFGDSVHSILPLGTSLLAGDQDSLSRSVDGGKSWNRVIRTETGQVNALLEVGQTVFAGTWHGLFRSTDNGLSWNASNTGLADTNIYSLVSSGSSLFAGSSSGVYRSTDNGGSWESASSGLLNSNVASLATIGGNLLAGCAPGGIHRSSDEGSSWASTDPDVVCTSTNAIEAFGTSIYAATGVGIARSTDLGVHWADWSAGLHGAGVYALAILNASSVSPLFFTATTDSVFSSTNLGGSWIPSSNGVGVSGKHSLASLDPEIYVGDDFGVYRSKDSGRSWIATNSGLVSFVNALYVFNTILFAATNQGIYRFRHSDSTWHFTSKDLTNQVTFSLASIGSTLFAGTYIGVFASTDSGATWSAANDGLINVPINAMIVQGEYLYAATKGEGVWQRPLAEMGAANAVASTKISIPEVRCYPNPFGQSANLLFTSATTSASVYATVSIVNLFGVEVAHLFEGELTSGEHSFVWQTAGLPDGLYECVIRMNDHVEKLPLIKLK